jgi:hypothetical protein
MPRALPPLEGNKAPNIPPSVVESVAGFSAGVISCLTVHPLDLLKNRLQRENHCQFSFLGRANMYSSEHPERFPARRLHPHLSQCDTR